MERLAELQTMLYANATWSVLLVFQAMDAAGKDSTISHVMSGVNPQGVAVTSFKQPSSDELGHDFLWRINRALPARGIIGIFNRSHYEEVLVARVHPEILDAAHLPPSLKEGDHLWDHRIEDIAAFERHLARQGTRILKFFLNVGKDEQKKRFFDASRRAREELEVQRFGRGRARLLGQVSWKPMQEAIAGTATKEAPWYVIPADHKWLTRLVVITAINDDPGAASICSRCRCHRRPSSRTQAAKHAQKLEAEP